MAKVTGIRFKAACALCVREVICREGDGPSEFPTWEELEAIGWRKEGMTVLCPAHGGTLDFSGVERVTAMARIHARTKAQRNGLPFYILDGELCRPGEARPASPEELELWGKL